jgi:hypothetical protein
MGLRRTQSRRGHDERPAGAVVRPSRGRRLLVETLEDRRMLATLTVTTLDDHATSPPVGSLRAQIIAANATTEADEIVFAAGLTGSVMLKDQLPTITRSLTITGPGAELLTLDAGGGATANWGDGYRIFNIESLTSIQVALDGMALTGGDPSLGSFGGNGGAIRNRNHLTIQDCVISLNSTWSRGGAIYSANTSGSTLNSLSIVGSTISNNRGSYGGGIYSDSGSLSLSDTSINGNTSDGGGGGIYRVGFGEFEIFCSSIVGNSTAGFGGGIVCSSSGLSIFASTVSGNSAGTTGGGLLVGSTPTTIRASIFRDNVATGGNGGAIHSAGSSLTLVDSEIAGNQTSGNGGGVWSSGSSQIIGSTLSGNSAEGYGGGLYNHSGVTAVVASTFSTNSAAVGGGGGVVGMGDENTSTRVRSSIIAGNIGGDVAVAGGALNAFQSNGANVIGSGNNFGTGPNALDAFSAMLGDQINIADPMLGPLADNGGLTRTHALLPGSPAIDRGDGVLYNIAREGFAWQSSEFRGGLGPTVWPARNAIDGIYSNFTHTSAPDSNATWRVTLRDDFPISEIVLHNRTQLTPSYNSRLRDITVKVLDANGDVVFTSELFNPENILGNMTLGMGPDNLAIDLVAITGGPIVGRTIQVTRTPDPDLSGSGGMGNEDEYNVLSLAEVEVLTAIDQRGLPRVVNGKADVGAFESQVATTPDFDGNGQVDGNDFLAWQRGLGKVTPSQADGNADGDGDVDHGDLAAWKAHFDATGLPTAASAGTSARTVEQASAAVAANSSDTEPIDIAYAQIFGGGDFTTLFSAADEFRPTGRARWRPRR